jgi:hypothetical protein
MNKTDEQKKGFPSQDKTVRKRVVRAVKCEPSTAAGYLETCEEAPTIRHEWHAITSLIMQRYLKQEGALGLYLEVLQSHKIVVFVDDIVSDRFKCLYTVHHRYRSQDRVHGKEAIMRAIHTEEGQGEEK